MSGRTDFTVYWRDGTLLATCEGQRQVSVRLTEHQIEFQWRQQGGWGEGVLSHGIRCFTGTPTASQLLSIGSARPDLVLRNDGKILNAVQ